MRRFVDTSALLPFLHGADAGHTALLAAWRATRAAGATLTTSNYVILECAALVQRRLGIEALRDLMLDVVPLLDVIWVDEEIQGTAVDSLLASGRRALSLVDTTSFVLMRRLSITTALALDAHFREQGFECIP